MNESKKLRVWLYFSLGIAIGLSVLIILMTISHMNGQKSIAGDNEYAQKAHENFIGTYHKQTNYQTTVGQD